MTKIVSYFCNELNLANLTTHLYRGSEQTKPDFEVVNSNHHSADSNLAALMVTLST